MTQDPGKVLPSLLATGVVVRSTRKTLSVTFHDAREVSSATDRQVANWIKEFERAPRSETNGVSDAQVEAPYPPACYPCCCDLIVCQPIYSVHEPVFSTKKRPCPGNL